eukprot:5213-Heterococcus_DN1.PRE.2
MRRCCSVLLLAVTPAYSFKSSYCRPTLQPSVFCTCNSERSVPTPAREPVHRQRAVLQMASSGAPKHKAAAEVAAASVAAELAKAGKQAALPDEGQLAATVTALNNSHTLSSLAATSHSASVLVGSACVPAAGVHQQSVDAQHLAEFMNIALSFDQTAYSVLASFGFTLLYSICSLAAGRAVDVLSRKGTTVLACFSWSAVTAAQGLANSFPEVFGLRVLQGIAQAFTTPAAYTLLADAFPESSRATANGIYSSGVYVGGACASLTVLLTASIGWRDCSLLAGSIGIATALLAQAVLREPQRSDAPEQTVADAATVPEAVADGAGLAGVTQSLSTVFSSKTAKLVYAAAAVRFMAGFAIGIWGAPYFRGAFPEDAAQYAVINAAIVAVGGVSSNVLGGYLSDKLFPIDARYRAWVPLTGCLLSIPAWAYVVSTDSFYTAMICLGVKYLVGECCMPACASRDCNVAQLMQRTASTKGALPSSVRGTAQGVFSMLTAVGNVAPVAIGALAAHYPLQTVVLLAPRSSSAVGAVEHAIAYMKLDVLLYSVPTLYAVSALLFYLTGESVAADERIVLSNSDQKQQ